MTLPRSRAEVAPVAAIALVDERGDLRLGQRFGQVLARGWRSPPPPSSARSSRPALRNASTDSRRVLTSRVRTASVLVVGQGLALALLDVVGGIDRHAQHITTQRVPATHGGRDIGLDAFLKGHRSGYLGRSFETPVGRAEPRSSGDASAQPACVRAFFLRFASLRFRFTDGFS